ncbi:MAG: glycoside hydrolase family 3 protein [Clostridia bacterium]|nr:glycoside hydrolase family 3 protein [Clostridia bacterium]
MRNPKINYFEKNKIQITIATLVAIMCAALVLVGCQNKADKGVASSSPEVTESHTLLPTFAAIHTPTILPTETPSPMPTEVLTATPVITGTPTLAPTSTPTPSATPNPTPTIKPTATPTQAPTQEPVTAEQILSTMTLEEKIYQMFIVSPEDLSVGQGSITAYTDADMEFLKEHPVGGVIYFENNIVNPEQTKNMLQTIRKYSEDNLGLPLFACVDEEGGRVARIANNSAFNVEKFDGMGAVATEEEAYNIGKTIGAYLAELGFDFDFAPVADVLSREGSAVIGDRSFGTDPHRVSAFAAAAAKGLESNNIMSTFKHFPGHGATTADSHSDYAVTEKTYEELKQGDLIPFANASENNVSAIMVAHISVPNVIGDNTPCSLSYKMVTEILKGELGYRGLVITDALNMGAISKNYTPAEAAIKAVEAGNDVLLMPLDPENTAEGLINAVKSGRISESRIDDAVLKIIEAKLNH